MGETRFVGYDRDEADSKVKAILVGGERVAEASAGDQAEIILDTTPLYAETGGQVGDTGSLAGDGAVVKITDATTPVPGLFVHHGKIERGKVKVEDQVCARIDVERRQRIVRNHSATHLLHAALRQVLGDHVKQSGSLVAPDRLRFDFSHFSPITRRELRRVEELVNRRICENLPIATEFLPFEEALARGAIALFGEKYGEQVRLVRVGDTSMELCGGTHARATGEIGLFKIVHEGSVAAGVRRIEALTGDAAYQHVADEEEILARIQSLAKAKPMEEATRVAALLERLRELEKENRRLKDRLVARETGAATEDQERVQEVKGVRVLVQQIEDADAGSLRTFVDSGKGRLKSGVVVVGAAADDKALLAVGVTKDLTNRLHAGKIINEIASIVDGTGGGRADLAQAGGKNPSGLSDALERAPSIIESML
jgi:alanyl-tRNA synthetase